MRTSSSKTVGRARAALLSAVCLSAFAHLSPLEASGQTVPGGSQSTYEKARGFPPPAAEHEKVFNIEPPTKGPPDAGARQRALAAAQIREDFRRIQLLNNSLRARPSGAPGSEQAVSKTAAEIRKRSRRLKANLALPREAAGVARPGETSSAGGAPLPELLAELDGHVRSFVTNPMFGDMQSVDARLAELAERELEAIIELSGQIARSAATRKR